MFRVGVPAALADQRIRETAIRSLTGASIVAVSQSGRTTINPEPDTRLESGAELILVGTVDAENAFFERFGERDRAKTG
jgi:K+/H+ antiporter YhaU regulatory subunit KhtT